MRNFFISDSKVLTENKISHFDFRIYEYLCSKFNVKKISAYVRINDAAPCFLNPMESKNFLCLGRSKIK